MISFLEWLNEARVSGLASAGKSFEQRITNDVIQKLDKYGIAATPGKSDSDYADISVEMPSGEHFQIEVKDLPAQAFNTTFNIRYDATRRVFVFEDNRYQSFTALWNKYFLSDNPNAVKADAKFFDLLEERTKLQLRGKYNIVLDTDPRGNITIDDCIDLTRKDIYLTPSVLKTFGRPRAGIIAWIYNFYNPEHEAKSFSSVMKLSKYGDDDQSPFKKLPTSLARFCDGGNTTSIFTLEHSMELVKHWYVYCRNSPTRTDDFDFGSVLYSIHRRKGEIYISTLLDSDPLNLKRNNILFDTPVGKFQDEVTALVNISIESIANSIESRTKTLNVITRSRLI